MCIRDRYIAVTAALVVLVSVPLMFAAPAPAAPPVNPAPAGADQLYSVPAGTISTPLTGATVNDPALQMVAVLLAMAGFGFTVTVTVNVAPTQLPNNTDDVGVTVYVAVTAAFVVLVSVPLMFAAPAPAAPPVNPAPAGAAQLYSVPAGTIPLVTSTGATVKPVALHTVADIFPMAGLGFTVTVTVNVAPTQLPSATDEVGVTV